MIHLTMINEGAGKSEIMIYSIVNINQCVNVLSTSGTANEYLQYQDVTCYATETLLANMIETYLFCSYIWFDGTELHQGQTIPTHKSLNLQILLTGQRLCFHNDSVNMALHTKVCSLIIYVKVQT